MRLVKTALAAIAIAASALNANAQYYQAVNQVTNMVSAAIRGGANYRGMVDLSYQNGVGSKQANFLELSTTQGFKYGSMFYMGVGAGINYMSTVVNDGSYRPSGDTTTKSAMIPLFTDFRLNFGNEQASSLFIDLRLGAAFYINNKYILVGDGYVNSGQGFYLRPGVGVRIPINAANRKQAVNVSVNYQLITNSYWYNPGAHNSVTLSSIGATVGFEW